MQNRSLIRLDDKLPSPRAEILRTNLEERIVGQRRAINAIVNLYEGIQCGTLQEGRPLGTFLFMGPTGVGKTLTIEAMAEAFFGSPQAMIKVNCGEFQHSHEIAKLIGSPPGYLGHRETPPLLTQDAIAKHHTEQHPFTIVLFDEIEKASSSLWQLLLGILDKGRVTLGDNNPVNMSQCVIFMTSNLGSREMSELITGSIGFAKPASRAMIESDIDQKLYRTAIESARRNFTPEFMNRVDKVVVFRSLTDEHMKMVLDLEIRRVQRAFYASQQGSIRIEVDISAREFLLDEGRDMRYGARHIKRAVRRFLELPIARLLNTKQLGSGDLMVIRANEEGKLEYFREVFGTLI